MVDKICFTLIRCKTKFVCNPIKNSIMKKLILLIYYNDNCEEEEYKEGGCHY